MRIEKKAQQLCMIDIERRTHEFIQNRLVPQQPLYYYQTHMKMIVLM